MRTPSLGGRGPAAIVVVWVVSNEEGKGDWMACVSVQVLGVYKERFGFGGDGEPL